MKGFTKDGKFHPITEYKGVRTSRDPKAKSQGVKVERKARVIEDEFPLDTVMMKMERTFEISLKKHDFKNPKLQRKDWEIGITYEGGYSEEHFSFWAQPKDRSIEPITYRSWISNFDWSEGLGDETTFGGEAFQKKLESDTNFAEREYAKWLAESFESGIDHWFFELIDAIEDENE